MTVAFKMTGEKQLKARLTAIGKAPRAMLGEIGIRSVAEAKRLVPRRTGNLRRTIRIGAHTDTYVEIRAGGQRNVGYAAAVEFGSKPHVIVPRKAKVLAWGGARTLGGRSRAGSRATNFARRVNHPGTRAKPYLIPGIEKALSIVGLNGLIKRWNQAG